MEELGRPIIRIVSKESDKDVNEHDTLEVSVGAKVMLLKNLNTGMGLVNGSQGYITEILHGENNEPTIIMVSFDSYLGPGLIPGSNAIPISAEKTQMSKTSPSGITRKWTRTQFPLRLSWGITVHKSQSLTLPQVVIDMRGFPRSFSYKLYILFFVAISRVRNFGDVLLMHEIEEYMISSGEDAKIVERQILESRLETLCLNTKIRHQLM